MLVVDVALLVVLRDARPADKTEIYSRLGLRLIYQRTAPNQSFEQRSAS